MKQLFKKWGLAIAAVGPGLFLIGYNIGTGSVTTMAQTGANHGMSLFWALILSCAFTYVLMVAYGNHSLISGKTALYSLKTEFRWGWLVAMYILAAIIIGELLALMGIMGIVSDLVRIGMDMAFGNSPDSIWIILVLSAGIYYLIWKGQYRLFEKVLTIFVILMALSFLVVFILVKPNLASIFSGMVPSLENKPGSFGLIAAIAGTTCSAAVFVVRSIVVKEKKWGAKDISVAKRDSFVSATMMLLLSGLIMAVAAGTLFKTGQTIENTFDMVHLFEPLGGKLAALVLILGVASAGLSTIFPIVLIAPWLIRDYQGKPNDMRSPLFRWLTLIGLIFAFGSVVIEQRPPALMLFSQAFQACILPAISIPMLIMLNKRKIMGAYIASNRMNAAMLAVVIFSIITTWMAITDLF